MCLNFRQAPRYWLVSFSRTIQVAGVLLTFLCSGYCQSTPGGPSTASENIDQALQKLDQTPIGKRVAEIERKWSTAVRESDGTISQCQQELNELANTADYRDYVKKRTALYEKQDTRWNGERAVMSEKARALYSARHERLAKLAVSDLSGARKTGLNVLTYPRVDGSTSTQPLSVIIASRILGAQYEWTYPEPRGSPYYRRARDPDEFYSYDLHEASGKKSDKEFTFVDSQVVARAPRRGEERLALMINSLLAASSSTHSAYVNLIARKCDLNLTARGPSAEEKALAQKEGVAIELKPIARDALVFIVNHQNPVKSISRQQIIEIYNGTLSDWSTLGGGSAAVTAFWRERNSGSRELFETLVTPGHPLTEPRRSQDLFSDSMSGPYNQVSVSTNGIGYSVYYYENLMALSPYTRTVAIDGVEPGPDSIANGKYPYVCEVFAAYRADQPADSAAMKLLNWLLSPEGQSVVRESGYVPIKTIRD
jgi:phosphate transport system substrate-binding protein